MAEIAVITISDRAFAGSYADRSGPAAVQGFEQAGHSATVTVVPDDPGQVTAAVRHAIEAGAAVVFTTGGTGLAPRDQTPQTVAAMLDFEVPGIVEEIRRRSVPKVPNAMISRAVAGVVTVGARRAFVLTAPGSVGGVRDSIAVLLEVLDHVVDQVVGSDHAG